jgi:hypothetical protein
MSLYILPQTAYYQNRVNMLSRFHMSVMLAIICSNFAVFR